MSWFLIALIAPVLWSLTNHIDKHLISRHFKGEGVGMLMIFSAAVGLFILPIIYLIQPSAILIKSSLAVLIVINGILITVFFPKFNQETLDKKLIFQKLILILIMFIGVILLS